MYVAPNSDSVSMRRKMDLTPHELAGLIRKLRWARLEYEAEELALIMRKFPLDQRVTVSAGPFSTD